MTEFWLLLAPTEPTECSVLSENLYVVGPRLYTTAGLSDRTPAWALHIIEYTAPAPLLQRCQSRSRCVSCVFLMGVQASFEYGKRGQNTRA